jgi:uncharacterized repeat protein (TIGR03803 family)
MNIKPTSTKLFWKPAGGSLLWLLLMGAPVQQGAGQGYSMVYQFNGTDGWRPAGNIEVSGSTLYGVTLGGANRGQVYKINLDGTGFAVLKTFPNAHHAIAGIGLSGDRLFGSVAEGATTAGNIYTLSTSGTDFSVLKYFPNSGVDGFWPDANLVINGTSMYGTAPWGGPAAKGIVFQMQTDGAGFTLLKNFQGGADGCEPEAGLLLLGSALYGTTGGRCDSGAGTVFRLSTDGSGYAVLKRFSGGDGSIPQAALAWNGTCLFGTTTYGGTGYTGNQYSGDGVVFRINPDGTGFAVLHYFSGQDGSHPSATLAVAGDTLYGTTTSGGLSNRGTLFQVDVDGSRFGVLKSFAGADGCSPRSRLIVSGSTLYGTTEWGGPGYNGVETSGNGVVFRFTPGPPVLTALPQSQTAEIGTSLRFAVRAAGMPPLTYQWFFNATNEISGFVTNYLEFTNVQVTDAGIYAVVVTDFSGAATNASAGLSVIAPVERRPVPYISLTARPGSTWEVESLDTLKSGTWTRRGSIIMADTSQSFFDTSTPLPTQRYYRASELGGGGPPAVLKLPGMVSAISLNGEPGTSLRLDGIAAVGPTDAWFTLAAVTLTNSSQLYFDVSALGQPPRLYRIVPYP